ncbi:glycosyltransferase family 4 protein [Candidatus Babeliales bacterium]|nr:glycosyltransferase family 4 protein [Candidatus Babeliales bacterium]
MKILIIGHAYIAPINQEKWTTFARLNHDDQLTVVFPEKWKDSLFSQTKTETEPLFSNCTFIGLPAYNTWQEIKYRYHTKDLVRILREKKPDIIYVEQGDCAISYLQIILLSIFFSPRAKRLFFTWVNWKPKVSLKHNLFFGTIGKINRFFSHGAIVGNYDAQVILEDKKFKKPILVLPQLGINTNMEPHEKQHTQYRVGFIGRFAAEKGIFDLLHSFFSIQKQHPDWSLLFVGSGPEEKNLKKTIAELNLKEKVEIKEPVPHEEIFTILKEIDILVLPSYDIPTWREQFGHILIEAMALKIPIIGSTGGEIPNVIGNTGCIFIQRNISDLSTKMNLLMKNPEMRKSLGEKGFERVKQEYSHEVIAEKSRTFLKKLLSQ